MIKNLQWPLEKELVVNKEITDWQKYGGKTFGEGGWVSL